MRIFKSTYSIVKWLTIAPLFLLSLLPTLKAQHINSFTQFTENKQLYNPAACANDGNTILSLIAREQWVGFQGTPKIHGLSFTTRLPEKSNLVRNLRGSRRKSIRTENSNIGFGAYLYNDTNGPISKTGLNTTYAYHIDMGENQLSFGLTLMLFQFNINGKDFIFSDDEIDPIFPGKDYSFLNLDASFGVSFSSQNYFVGYSSVQLFNSAAQFGADAANSYKINREHNIVAAYKFPINAFFELQPSTLIQVPENLLPRYGVGVKTIYLEKYNIGLNYRNGSALSFNAGLNYNIYYFGYAFDYNLSDLMPNSIGSHEFFISVKLGR